MKPKQLYNKTNNTKHKPSWAVTDDEEEEGEEDEDAATHRQPHNETEGGHSSNKAHQQGYVHHHQHRQGRNLEERLHPLLGETTHLLCGVKNEGWGEVI